jgi:N,N'-diacetyllegionaminate synthase
MLRAATPPSWFSDLGRPGAKPLIIAELGVNHDGSPARALQLVDAAAAAGADAVKLQLFTARGLMSRASRLAKYQSQAGEQDPWAMLARLELDASSMRQVVEHARRAGMLAIVTVFSVDLVAQAEAIGFDAYKSASPDVIHRPLLEAMASTGKPLIISTGASTLDEVARAVDWLAFARERIALLQCVSSYPTPQESAELGGITALRQAFGLPIGYSDHTPDEGTGAIAVRRGACILEKHFTLDCAAPGPDHAASLEPAAMRTYIEQARAAMLAPPQPMLPPRKRVLPIEQDVRTVSRQSIVTRLDLPAATVLRPEHLTFKRPGTGLPPYAFDAVLGRTLAHPVLADTPLQAADLA